MKVPGTFFPGHSSRPVPAEASVTADGLLRIADTGGAVLAELSMKKVRASQRLGQLRRRLELPGAGHFETADNDGVDALLRAAGRRRAGRLVDRIERSLPWIAASFVFAAVSAALMVIYGFPAVAAWLAFQTPRPVMVALSGQTLKTLDRLMLQPSILDATQQRRARALFARIAVAGAGGRSGYRLVLRAGAAVGPNAFSLPDGTVVLTDELFVRVRTDDELEGVFGHEIAHADRRHALQMLYEGALFPVAFALLTGDPSQFAQIATVLPTMLIQSHYSRGFEQQADDDSAAMMRRIGGNPAALGILLLRLERELCGAQDCSPGWLGSHPATAERAARLRAESAPAR